MNKRVAMFQEWLPNFIEFLDDYGMKKARTKPF